MRAAFSGLAAQYNFDKTASVDKNNLAFESKFELPAPLGEVCIRFANGAVTSCPSSTSQHTVLSMSEVSAAEQEQFATYGNHTAVHHPVLLQ